MQSQLYETFGYQIPVPSLIATITTSVVTCPISHLVVAVFLHTQM
jgi:hypothetical protein